MPKAYSYVPVRLRSPARHYTGSERPASCRRQRRLRRLATGVLAIVMVLLAAFSISQPWSAAASCSGPPGEFSSFTSAAVVLEGVALDGPASESGRLSDPVLFEVSRYFKGSGASHLPIETGFSVDGDKVYMRSDGLDVRAGETWRLYAYPGLSAVPEALSVTLCSASERLPTPSSAPKVHRIGGSSRIDTAALISAQAFPDGSLLAYLARADDPADALAARSLEGGPVLLVPSCGRLPSVVAEELARLSPETIVPLGGQRAVCDDMVEEAVRAVEGPR